MKKLNSLVWYLLEQAIRLFIHNFNAYRWTNAIYTFEYDGKNYAIVKDGMT